MQLSKSDQEMTEKYKEFKIFVNYGVANGIHMNYCRFYIFSYSDMLDRLKECLSSKYINISVQYGNSYTDIYRYNGTDMLKAHENTKLFKKMVLEYKMRGEHNA